MLCDAIIADKYLPRQYPGFNVLQGLLSTAHKYVLAPDFTAAADGLVNNYDELKRIVPFCRLPAQTCWFELAQGDRPHWLNAPMHFEQNQLPPHRIGYLCHARDPTKLWEWDTVLCWSLIAPRNGIVELIPGVVTGLGTPNNASQIMVWFNTKDGFREEDPHRELENYIELCIAPFCLPKVRAEIKANSGGFLIQLMQSDWGGEIRYLFATLGLFNARNVVEAEAIDKTKHNKKRVAQGKPPFHNHTLLKIRAMHRRSLVGVPGKGTAADVREHFVSGHWKARRTGLFWWNPHWRGNPERGSVSHDYEVHT